MILVKASWFPPKRFRAITMAFQRFAIVDSARTIMTNRNTDANDSKLWDLHVCWILLTHAPLSSVLRKQQQAGHLLICLTENPLGNDFGFDDLKIPGWLHCVSSDLDLVLLHLWYSHLHCIWDWVSLQKKSFKGNLARNSQNNMSKFGLKSPIWAMWLAKNLT